MRRDIHRTGAATPPHVHQKCHYNSAGLVWWVVLWSRRRERSNDRVASTRSAWFVATQGCNRTGSFEKLQPRQMYLLFHTSAPYTISSIFSNLLTGELSGLFLSTIPHPSTHTHTLQLVGLSSCPRTCAEQTDHGTVIATLLLKRENATHPASPCPAYV